MCMFAFTYTKCGPSGSLWGAGFWNIFLSFTIDTSVYFKIREGVMLLLLKAIKEEDVLPYPEAACLERALSRKDGLTDSHLSAHLLRLWAGHLPLATDGHGSNLTVLVGNSSCSTSKTWGSRWLNAIEVTPCISAVWSGCVAGDRPRLLPPYDSCQNPPASSPRRPG